MAKFTHETDITGYNILTNEDLDALHEATLQLMEDYGLQMHGKEALDILAGARLRSGLRERQSEVPS